MLKSLRRVRLPVAICSLCALTACETMNLDPAMMGGGNYGGMGGGGGGMGGIGDLMSMPGNLRSLASRPTSAGDVLNKIHVATTIIATVQRYAALSAQQRQHVESTVSRKYDGMVRTEKQALAPKYASRREEVRKRGQVRFAEAKNQQPAAAARIEAETRKEVAKVDMEWEKAARSSVAKNYGTDFAVPVQNSSGKAVVAFASVKDSGVSVSDSSYEVAGSTGSLSSSTKIAHSGKTYAVLK